MSELFREEASDAQPAAPEEGESEDEEVPEPRQTGWLVARFVQEYRERAHSQFAEKPLLKAIIEEYIDLLETPYFESALYELLQSSFARDLRDFLLTSLSKPFAQLDQP